MDEVIINMQVLRNSNETIQLQHRNNHLLCWHFLPWQMETNKEISVKIIWMNVFYELNAETKAQNTMLLRESELGMRRAGSGASERQRGRWWQRQSG